MLQFALEQGIDIESSDCNDYSALHRPAENGMYEVCELLLKHGANVNRKSNKTGHTPLSLVFFNPGHTNLLPFSFFKKQTLQVLLEYGAKVADTFKNRSILEVAADDGDGRKCLRNILMQHMAKMKYLNLEVSEFDLRTIESKDCYRKHYEECLNEIETMRKTKFYNNLHIANILLRSKKVISRYVRNEEMMKAFDDGNYDGMFPVYFASLRRRIDGEIEKRRLRDPAAEILSNIFEFNDPFHPVNQEIISVLSDYDCKFLII